MTSHQSDNTIQTSHGAKLILNDSIFKVQVHDAAGLIQVIGEGIAETSRTLEKEIQEATEKISEKLTEEVETANDTSSLGEFAEWAVIGTVLSHDGPISELRDKLELVEQVFGVRNEEEDPSPMNTSLDVADDTEKQVRANRNEDMLSTESTIDSNSLSHHDNSEIETMPGSSVSVTFGSSGKKSDSIELKVEVEKINALVESIFTTVNESVLPATFDLSETIAASSTDFFFSVAEFVQENVKSLSDAVQEHTLLAYTLLSDDSKEEMRETLDLLTGYIGQSHDVYDSVGEYGKNLGQIDEQLQGMKVLTTQDDFTISGAEQNDDMHGISGYENSDSTPGYDEYSTYSTHEENYGGEGERGGEGEGGEGDGGGGSGGGGGGGGGGGEGEGEGGD